MIGKPSCLQHCSLCHLRKLEPVRALNVVDDLRPQNWVAALFQLPDFSGNKA